MPPKTKLEKAAEALVAVLERDAAHLPLLEREAKWRALGREVAKGGSSPKSGSQSKALPRLNRKHA